MPETKDPDGDGPERPDEPGNRRDMTPEDFARFLACLSPDPDEANRRYVRLQERLIAFFRMKGISDTEGAAIEAIERAAVLSRDGRAIPDMEKFCLGVARNIAHERRRRELREAATFNEIIRKLDENSDEEVERIERLLKPCFDQLSPEDQRLMEEYCRDLRGRARAEHRRRLAEKLKTTVLGLRMRVTRLRAALAECVRKRPESG